jgi:predicted RNA-binding Zn-ribbon protein involved in translation (DUF1610 family)
MYKATPSKEPSWKMPKGTWKELETEDKTSASFACPGCGEVGTLEDHEILGDGTVEPSVDCPAACGFHDMVTLEGWHGKNGIDKGV